MTTMLDALSDDCSIMMQRVLLNKNLVFFGEDGAGKHGTSIYPVTGHVYLVDVELDCDDEDNPSDIYGVVRIAMVGYDSAVTGHAITDQNLRIALNMCMKAEHVDPTALDWADISLQGQDYIVLDLDVSKLIEW